MGGKVGQNVFGGWQRFGNVVPEAGAGLTIEKVADGGKVFLSAEGVGVGR